MGKKTDISWCDATFNPIWGCTNVSPACDNCYAEPLAHRWGFDVWGAKEPRRTFGVAHWNEPLRWNREAAKLGVRFRVFAGSMCDVFENHPTTKAELEKLWPLIRATPHLDWLLLTKRPERIARSLPADWKLGFANVWLGTTVENDKYGIIRVPHLTQVPAVVHFLSVEPMLAPVEHTDLSHVQWVICGGESGPGARPMAEEWACALRDRCVSAGIPFFFKQLGGVRDPRGHELAVLDGRLWTEFPLMRGAAAIDESNVRALA